MNIGNVEKRFSEVTVKAVTITYDISLDSNAKKYLTRVLNDPSLAKASELLRTTIRNVDMHLAGIVDDSELIIREVYMHENGRGTVTAKCVPSNGAHVQKTIVFNIDFKRNAQWPATKTPIVSSLVS